jgi:hypothetical protein
MRYVSRVRVTDDAVPVETIDTPTDEDLQPVDADAAEFEYRIIP